METAYATALWKAVQAGMSPADAVRGLKEHLARSGRTQLLPKIARAFTRVAERNTAHATVTLSVARQHDAEKAKKAAHTILAELRAAPADVKVAVDDSLIGGWRLEGREKLVDASFKKQLLEMYARVTA